MDKNIFEMPYVCLDCLECSTQTDIKYKLKSHIRHCVPSWPIITPDYDKSMQLNMLHKRNIIYRSIYFFIFKIHRKNLKFNSHPSTKIFWTPLEIFEDVNRKNTDMLSLIVQCMQRHDTSIGFRWNTVIGGKRNDQNVIFWELRYFGP